MVNPVCEFLHSLESDKHLGLVLHALFVSRLTEKVIILVEVVDSVVEVCAGERARVRLFVVLELMIRNLEVAFVDRRQPVVVTRVCAGDSDKSQKRRCESFHSLSFISLIISGKA